MNQKTAAPRPAATNIIGRFDDSSVLAATTSGSEFVTALLLVVLAFELALVLETAEPGLDSACLAINAESWVTMTGSKFAAGYWLSALASGLAATMANSRHFVKLFNFTSFPSETLEVF
ncbi:MAG: hypothetical protein ACK443_03775 [Methylococcaceae bacterium]